MFYRRRLEVDTRNKEKQLRACHVCRRKDTDLVLDQARARLPSCSAPVNLPTGLPIVGPREFLTLLVGHRARGLGT